MVKRRGFPEVEEVVLCRVKKISPLAAWVNLEEYSNIEGMIHISEVAGKWVRDIRDFVKLGKHYVAKVIRVDKQKKFVKLSLRRVSKFEEKEKLNEYRKEQRAEKILEQAASELKKSLEQAYEEIGFFLQERFGSLSKAFEEIRKSKDVLSKLEISKDWAEALARVVEKAFREKEVEIKAEIELRSYESDGIERIKKILFELEKLGEIKYISAPKYRLEIKTKNPKVEEKKLREALKKVFKNIKQLGIEGSYRMIK